ncbi:putative ubiquinol--cytochrome-c reductase [Thamnocephalis sphaerospora]|uniref:Cytochrome b-c1 complex subunit 7 n=1 Tax=Thamnocephalis sphaerospora TaxID=78915 RepID=A0A4P9XKJ4_9FUNG|nr:putative ubiquinol--cytochrome-c reductase [Thamnocephalis sphaerospora]|eukprot:RKP06327.1 putative ubiquinol--cytochrome-c reductase [Thamnocephalis sphaerospora]
MSLNRIFAAGQSVLHSVLRPFSGAFANAAGYRRLGLRYDDLLIEETDAMQEAIRRLPEAEQVARAYRFRRAFQLSLTHSELPKEQWTKPNEDIRYLTPILEEVEREFAERSAFEHMAIRK